MMAIILKGSVNMDNKRESQPETPFPILCLQPSSKIGPKWPIVKIFALNLTFLILKNIF